MNSFDVENMNNSLQGLSQTLLQNRVLKQRAQEADANRALDQSQFGAQMDYRNRALEEAVKRDTYNQDPENPINQQRTARADATVTNANAKKHPFYVIDTASGNIMGTDGTFDDANKILAGLKAQKPDSQLTIVDKPPDTLKDRNEIPISDTQTVYLSDADAAKYYLKKAELKQKAEQLKTPTPVAPRETVRQVVNPAHVVGGVVDTNTPPYLSLTNTTAPMTIGSSGLPNLAPATTNNASVSPYKSANDVKAAYKAGKLDKATATKLLQTQFGLQ